jgi:hypothetical protein
MAEEIKKDQATCRCGAGMGVCGCGSYGRCWFRIVRAIFIVIAMVIVFALGMKIGELKGMLESRGGYNMMGGRSYGAYPMMRGGQGFAPGTATSSAQ